MISDANGKCHTIFHRLKLQPDMVYRAEMLAIIAHAAVGQRRKYTGLPYATHCDAVVSLIWGSDVIYPDEVIAAAYLHDVLEDTEVTADDLRQCFPEDVVSLVLEVTDVSKPSDGNRALRKALDRKHLTEASPYGKTIKLADLIDNSSSIAAHDPKFAKTYMREKRLLLPVLADGDADLFRQASDIVDRYFAAEPTTSAGKASTQKSA